MMGSEDVLGPNGNVASEGEPQEVTLVDSKSPGIYLCLRVGSCLSAFYGL